MSNNLNPYDYFSNFILRTPLLPFNFYKNLTKGEIVEDESLKRAFEKPEIKEAIFLASPILYFELEKWVANELDQKKVASIRLSLLKYLTRMTTRCTPFGLFAGCCLGTFSEETEIRIAENHSHKRFTRLDMNYLVALSQDFSKRDYIKEQLTYFPNSSIYLLGGQLRYIEYSYKKNIRQHHIIEIDNSPYLQKILKRANKGASLKELANEIIDDSISKEEAYGFLDELLESQVLTSSLEPSVSGPPFVNQMLKVLNLLINCETEIKFLKEVSQQFNLFDKRLGNNPKQYLKFSTFLKDQPTVFELKYLFQTDIEMSTEICNLSENHLSQIKQVQALLNKITPSSSENNISRFKDAFYERYEEREMQLCNVLDVETGIGYLQNTGAGDVNPLVDDLFIPQKEDQFVQSKLNWNNFYKVLGQKLDSLSEENEKIILKDEDFVAFGTNWDDLPDTMSSLVEIVGDTKIQKIKLSGFGGSSAANLLGRFCHEKSAITKFTQSIIETETKINSDKILAEIVHLPESRAGNILMRPNFRQYEIPYLANSTLNQKNQINLNDLYISIKQNKIVLRSKILDKEIIPHLTNAHNFSSNALPIYHFLCDMQTQGLRGYVSFNFGPLSQIHHFLPRVEYKDIILHEARWRILKEDIKTVLDNKSNTSNLKTAIAAFRKQMRLPKYVMLTDGDNELLIDFNNITSVQMLLESVKKRSEFTLTEFLHTDGGVVKSKDSYYTNQVLISFYNKNKTKPLNNKD